MIISSEKIILFSLLGIVLGLAALVDLKVRKIPNLLTFPTILAALAYHSVSGGLDGFLFSLLGSLAGIGLLIIPYLLGGAGAGDAKLLGSAGAVLGPGGVAGAFLYIAAIGGCVLVFFLLCNRKKYGIYFQRHLIMMKALLYTGRHFHVPATPEEIQASRISYGTIIALGTILYMALEVSGRNPINI